MNARCATPLWLALAWLAAGAAPPPEPAPPPFPPLPPPRAPAPDAPRAPEAPCIEAARPIEAPARLSFEEAEFRAAAPVCASTGGWLRPNLGLLVALSEYRGLIDAGASIGGRVRLGHEIALTFAMDVVRWTYALNATIGRTSLGTGNATVGATLGNLAFERYGARFVPTVRLLLPTSSTWHTARAVGVDAALAFGLRPRPWLDVFGSFGHAVWGAVSSAGVHAWHGPAVTIGAAATIGGRFSIVLQADVHGKAGVGVFDVERLALSAALRLRLGRGVRVELAAGRPLYGADHTDVRGGLTVAVESR